MFTLNTAFLRVIMVCLLLLIVSDISGGQTRTTESPNDNSSERGTLIGQFIYSGKPNARNLVQLRKKLELDNAGRSIVPDNPYYFDKDIYDESLLVGKDGGIANVVVFVRDKDIPLLPERLADKAPRKVLQIEDGRFVPHICIIRTGKPLSISNSDPVPLNVLFNGRNSNWNILLSSNAKRNLKMEKNEPFPLRVQSNINWWMTGYIFPRSNPYVTITNVDGRFKLERLPVGEWEFQVWHERTGWLITDDWPKGRFTFTIRPGTNDLGDVVTPLDN